MGRGGQVGPGAGCLFFIKNPILKLETGLKFLSNVDYAHTLKKFGEKISNGKGVIDLSSKIDLGHSFGLSGRTRTLLNCSNLALLL